MASGGGNTLQTLDRGLQALKLVAERPEGLSVAELAETLGVHRAIAYRIVTTLERHSLIVRGPEGNICLGSASMLLGARFEPHFRAIAQPRLRELAQATRATAFISMAVGEECMAMMVAEPEEGLLRVSYRVGSRHPLTRGAAGIAILAGRPERPDDTEEVRQARRDGYSITRGQLQKGAVGVASPILSGYGRVSGFEACVGVVAMDDLVVERAAEAVKACARELAELTG